MSKRNVLRGAVLDSRTSFTMDELCQVCRIETNLVVEMVQEGVLEPVAAEPNWRFSGHEVVRAQRAMNLIRDLGVNWAGAALALELLDRLEQLENTGRLDRV
jgi:chaperone modulatory protein CbpM